MFRSGAIQHSAQPLLSPDGKWVLAQGATGSDRLFDTATGRPAGPPLPNGESGSAALRPDGGAFALSLDERTVRLADPRTGRALPGHSWFRGRPRAGRSRFSPDGKFLLTRSLSFGSFGGSSSTAAQLWNAETGQRIGGVVASEGSLNHVAFRQDSSAFVLGLVNSRNWTGTIMIRDTAGAKPLAPPVQLTKLLLSLALSPDGATLAAGTADRSYESGQFQLWDAATLRPRGEPVSLPVPAFTLAFTKDGKGLLTAGGQRQGQMSEARLWDVATGEPLGPPLRTKGLIMNAAIHPGGRILLTSGVRTQLWDLATGRPIGPPITHGSLTRGSAFTPDGKTMVLSGQRPRLFQVPDLDDNLELAACWVKAMTGIETSAQGDIVPLDWAAWQAERERLVSLGGSPAPPERWRLDLVLAGDDPTARGKAWAERGNWSEAESAYSEAVAAWPHDPAMFWERARFYLDRGQDRKADADLVAALTLGGGDRQSDELDAPGPRPRRPVSATAGESGMPSEHHVLARSPGEFARGTARLAGGCRGAPRRRDDRAAVNPACHQAGRVPPRRRPRGRGAADPGRSLFSGRRRRGPHPRRGDRRVHAAGAQLWRCERQGPGTGRAHPGRSRAETGAGRS